MHDFYNKGLEEIAGIDPESGPAFVEELKTISPDFAEYFVGFAFGKIHARQIFEPKLKELVAIATLSRHLPQPTDAIRRTRVLPEIE